MISKSVAGVVSSKIGRHFTILLKNGNKIKLKTKTSSLELGDRCHVAFNSETGTVVELLGYNETPTNMSAIEPMEIMEVPHLEDGGHIDLN